MIIYTYIHIVKQNLINPINLYRLTSTDRNNQFYVSENVLLPILIKDYDMRTLFSFYPKLNENIEVVKLLLNLMPDIQIQMPLDICTIWKPV